VIENGLNKFYWGFLFIMMDIKISGFDILPDIIGYILFAIGFSILAEKSNFFINAENVNIVMIILSVFNIYEKPFQGEGVQFGVYGTLSVLLAIASLVFSLLVVYNLFMGIKDLAKTKAKFDIIEEVDKKWNQYLILRVAAMLAFVLMFIPPLAVIYIVVMLIASIFLTIIIMEFIKGCERCL